MTPADAAALASAYRDQGWTLDRCAAELGIGRARATSLLRAAGVTIRPAAAPPRPASAAGLIRAYTEQGWPAQRCGQAFGVSSRTVLKILRAQGVPVRRPGPQRAGTSPATVDPAALACAYCDDGWSLAHCAEKFGIGSRDVAAILRGTGVTIREQAACAPPGRPGRAGQRQHQPGLVTGTLRPGVRGRAWRSGRSGWPGLAAGMAAAGLRFMA